MLKKIGFGILVVIILAAVGFVIWGSITNPIMPEAAAALESDSQVAVVNGAFFKHGSTNWLVFQRQGKQLDTGFIFYPGGKVDYRAYAPFARAIANQGYLVVIPKMPLNLAVFDPAEAENVINAFPDIKYWAVGGHSLGGSMAANYAVRHPDQIRGLILLAAYPASPDSLANTGIKVASISATNDGLATYSKIDAARSLLPADTTYIVIRGGNHSQFGYYGLQNGDAKAAISRADQQSQTVKAAIDLLKTISFP